MLTLVGGAEGRGEVEVGTKRGGWERGASARALTPRVLVSTIQRHMDRLITWSLCTRLIYSKTYKLDGNNHLYPVQLAMADVSYNTGGHVCALTCFDSHT
jgi:hypothetical protein